MSSFLPTSYTKSAVYENPLNSSCIACVRTVGKGRVQVSTHSIFVDVSQKTKKARVLTAPMRERGKKGKQS